MDESPTDPYCSDCGTPNPLGKKFCGKCGSRFESGVTQPEDTQSTFNSENSKGESSVVKDEISQSKWSKKRVVVIAGGLALVLVVASLVTFLLGNKSASHSSSGSGQTLSDSGASSNSAALLPIPNISKVKPTKQVRVGVTVCPSYDLQQGGEVITGTPQPSTTLIYATSISTSALQVYTDANGYSRVVGPVGWSCSASGASGGLIVSVFPPGDINSDTTIGLTGHTYSSTGHSVWDACHYVADANKDIAKEYSYGSCDSKGLIKGIKVQAISSSAAVVSAPPGRVYGEGGVYKIRSLTLITFPPQDVYLASVTSCALPPQYQKYCLSALINTPGLFVSTNNSQSSSSDVGSQQPSATTDPRLPLSLFHLDVGSQQPSATTDSRIDISVAPGLPSCRKGGPCERPSGQGEPWVAAPQSLIDALNTQQPIPGPITPTSGYFVWVSKDPNNPTWFQFVVGASSSLDEQYQIGAPFVGWGIAQKVGGSWSPVNGPYNQGGEPMPGVPASVLADFNY